MCRVHRSQCRIVARRREAPGLKWFQRVTLEIGATPLPAALPLSATGVGAMRLLGWRGKRRAQAVV